MVSLAALILIAAPAADRYVWAPAAPGPAHASGQGAENRALFVGYAYGKLTLKNKWEGTALVLPTSKLRLQLRNGKELAVGEPSGFRIARQASPPGVAVSWTQRAKGSPLTAQARLVLRDDANYGRLIVTFTAARDLDVGVIDLLQIQDARAHIVGKSLGSPVTCGDYFFGVEHPMSVATIERNTARCGIKRALPLRAGTPVTYSAVLGIAPPGQMRRAFLNYVESERAHPYRPFLHYNNWLDTAYGRPFTQAECLDRIGKFGKQLVEKRGVKMESFLFDDGWDNTSSVWEFHSGFPNAFLPLRDAAAKYGAGVGVWLSPWGGYGRARQERLAYGKAHSMEVDSQGYALSGPNYYRRFHEVTMDFVTQQGIDMFKFDGTGSPDKMTPGSKFDSDFDAAISLIGDLRKARPDLFVNLTTGTWPSPFWLKYADSIWRGGSDSGYAGVGTKRQQWITYRDGDTYHGVVQRGPLYPLNSLMTHGLIYASHSGELKNDPGNDFADEIHSYFGSGTQLQEMYITPDLLSDQNWDDLAGAAKWSRDNADVLKDTHWVGGDPSKLDVYGWASWSARKSILVLRNPSDKPQAFSVDLASLLELPVRSAAHYSVREPWKSSRAPSVWRAEQPSVENLKPFEVKVVELTPRTIGAGDGAIPARPAQPSLSSPPPKPAFPIRVACVGASIVEGVGTSGPSKSYPSQLQRLLGTGYLVGNFGHSGATLTRATDLPYSSTAEYRRALEFSPSIVVIMLGTNDATRDRWPKVESLYVPQYRELIRTFQELPTRPRVFACIPSPTYDERQQNVEEAVVPLVKQIAREAGVDLIDFHSALEGRPELLPDKLHPNDEGASLLAQAAAEAIEDPALRKKAWRVVSFDSEEPGEGPAKNAIDGDPSTFWHTNYSSKETRPPHEIVVDMGSATRVAGFRYLPRQDGGINGRVKGFEVYFSADRKTWGNPALSGEIKDIVGWSSWTLASLVSARYFKFRALSEQHGAPWTSVGELDVRRAAAGE